MKQTVIEPLRELIKEEGISLFQVSKLTGIRYELLRRSFNGNRALLADEFLLILTSLYPEGEIRSALVDFMQLKK